MKPLSTYYEEEVRKWLRCNPGKVVTLGNISLLFGAAFIHAAIMKTAMKGFEATGIWPPNKNVFSDDDFLPSVVTDIVLSSEKENEVNKEITNKHSNLETPNSLNPDVLNRPQCSWMPDNQPSTFPVESPEDVLPIPKVKQIEKKNSRKRGKTVILTESPYKNEMQMSLKIAQKKKRRKRKKKQRKKRDTKEKIISEKAK